MSTEEYILAFESILYGLIVSRIIVNWNQLIQRDSNINHYWAFWTFSIAMFLLIIYVYVQNGLSDHYDKITYAITFLYYAIIPPTLFAFIVYQLFPKDLKNVDLKTHMIKNRIRIFAPLTVYIVITSISAIRSLYSLATLNTSIVILILIAVLISNRQWVLEVFIVVFISLLAIFGYMWPIRYLIF